MHDGTCDEVSVTFPATESFTRIGRVAVAGLALRLGIDMTVVERLRAAVDAAVEALHGQGRISLQARWEPAELHIVVNNPDAVIPDPSREAVNDRLADLVDRVEVEGSQIHLVLASEEAAHTTAVAD